jgi:hypothetical protein
VTAAPFRSSAADGAPARVCAVTGVGCQHGRREVGQVADDLAELFVPDASVWRDWLAEHHDRSPGVWLVVSRKGGSATSLTYVQAVEEALCFGWIDGQARRRDDQGYLQRMTPRRPRSPWSASNVERVTRLEREGRMHDAGRTVIRAAQADGRWAAAGGTGTSWPPAGSGSPGGYDRRAAEIADRLSGRPSALASRAVSAPAAGCPPRRSRPGRRPRSPGPRTPSAP